MLVTGFLLASITSVAFYMIYAKLPTWAKNFVQKHILVTRVAAALFTYMMFGETLVALFAAAFMDIILSIMLNLANNPETMGLMKRVCARLVQMKKKLFDLVSAGVMKLDSVMEEKVGAIETATNNK